MPSASINGIRLGYESAGHGEPIVFVHGLALGRRMWRRQVPAFRDRFRVIDYDLRGHGDSSAPADGDLYSEDVMGADLAGLLDHLDIGPAILVGSSMGASVALHLALHRPERVRALVLADIGSGSDDPQGARARAEQWAATVRSEGIAAFAEVMIASPFARHYAALGGHAGRHLRALIGRHSAQGIGWVLERVLGRRRPVYAHGEALRALIVPILVVLGERDAACARPCRFVAETAPGARLIELPGLGHLPPLEAPGRFNDAVGQFVRTLAAPIR